MTEDLKGRKRYWRFVAHDVARELDPLRLNQLLFELLEAIDEQVLQNNYDSPPAPDSAPKPRWIN